MQKIVFLIAGSLFLTFANAQVTDTAYSTPSVTSSSSDRASAKSLILPNRAGDHLMFQLSSDHWAGMPDSISSNQSGFSKGFNAYFMFNKPFKNSPKYSIGIGVGISTSNMSFKKMEVGLIAGGGLLPFTPTDSTNHFKKYKLTTAYAEVPLEFRYTAKPNSVNKSLKAALGIKVGTLLNAHTKGKSLQDKNNNLINSYIEKLNSKRFINSTRFAATARLGYGIFSIFGNYQLNNVLKDGAGADMKLYQVGLTISGL